MTVPYTWYSTLRHSGFSRPGLFQENGAMFIRGFYGKLITINGLRCYWLVDGGKPIPVDQVCGRTSPARYGLTFKNFT
jgi:hypothetical protein